MYRYPERCPRCNNLLNSEKICPGCQYQNVLTKEPSVGIQKRRILQSGNENDEIEGVDIPEVELTIKLTDSAARQIQELNLKALRKGLSSEDEKKRNRDAAEMWVNTFLNEKLIRAYIYNGGKGSKGDDLIEIHIATDVTMETNRSIYKNVDGGTLVLVGAEKEENHSDCIFLLTEAIRRNEDDGQYDKVMSFPVDIKFTEDSYTPGFDEEFISRLEDLPSKNSHRELVEQKMRHWSVYLDIMEKNLPKNQYRVKYTNIRQGTDKNEYYFFLEERKNLPWKQIERSKGWSIHLSTAGEKSLKQLDDLDGFKRKEQSSGQDVKLGKIDDVDKSKGKLVILLDENISNQIDFNNFRIPAQGLLIYKNEGDKSSVERMQAGMRKLANRLSANVNLNDFIFDSREAREILEIERINLSQEEMLNKVIFNNLEQKEAVEGALSAQDLYLIQGPPGTGKTTVIAEICYQIARQGGRTLIASQTNLAVDNVLSRLVHDKLIRSLRLGRAERVEEEGLPFTEDKVIGTWLTNTSKVQKFKLEQDINRLAVLEELLKYKKQIFHCLNILRNNHLKILEEKKEYQELLKKIRDRENEIAKLKSDLITVRKMYYELDALSTNTDTRSFEYLHDWIIRIPKSFRDHIVQFTLKKVQALEDQALRSVENSTISLKLSGEKTFIKQISELYKIKPDIEKEEKQNKKFLADLNSVLLQGMQLIEVMQDINLAESRLVDYQNTQKNIFAGNDDSVISDGGLLPNQQATFAERIKKIEINLKELILNRKAVLAYLNGILRNCEEAHPGIITHRLPEDPNAIHLQDVEKWGKQIKDILSACVKREKALSQLSSELDPKNLILKIKSEILEVGNGIFNSQTSQENENSGDSTKIEQIKNHLRALEIQIEKEKSWWDKFVSNPPEILEAYRFNSFVENEVEFERFKVEAKLWQKEEGVLRKYINQYKSFIIEWVNRLEAKDEQDVTELKEIYINNANVIGITCMQAGSRDFLQNNRNFNCVIVDEVTKATPVELILPLLKGRKIVLVGDHKQLPPMIDQSTFAELAESIKIPEERLNYIKQALFQDLYEQSPACLRIMLKIQYRMHPEIMNAINQFYDEKLICGIPNPNTKLDHGLEIHPWLKRSKHLIWIDFPIHEMYQDNEEGNKSHYNLAEINIVELLVEQIENYFQKKSPEEGKKKEIGVITFYAAQSERLTNALLKNRPPEKTFNHVNLRVGTVDRFQGIERPIIIASLVRNNKNQDIGFAKELERINVAFSRAQELLVIVGCGSLFSQEAKGNQGMAVRAYKKVYGLALKDNMVFQASELLSSYKQH